MSAVVHVALALRDDDPAAGAGVALGAASHMAVACGIVAEDFLAQARIAYEQAAASHSETTP